MSEPEASTAAMDRIGSLPDEIIIHILSFVPTKQAFATSILSKRWIHLWRHVPNLYFTDTKLSNLADNYRFNEFVYSILLSREAAGNHSINTFVLDIEYNYAKLAFRHSIPNVTNWVNYVVDRKIQHLNLYLDVYYVQNQNPPPNLPISVFSCTTLVVLKLHWLYVENGLSSDFSGFPLLKVLHLKEMYFDRYKEFILLLAGCPILEDLVVSNVHFRFLELELKNPFDFDHVFKGSSLRNLTSARIRECCHDFWVEAISNLKFLSIESWKDGFPIFHNLTHLKLYDDCGRVVKFNEVLQHCPKLQNLDFRQKSQRNSDDYISDSDDYIIDKEYWTDPEYVPRCLSLSLTTCTLRGFELTSLHGVFLLARYILKNARVLQTMKIWSVGERSPEIESKLSSCSRASTTCQLLFK